MKKSEDIESLIKEKKYYGGKNLVIYIKENHNEDHFHYAVSVSKKSGNAVNRNLLKRRLRSVVREANIKNGYDFFVVIKKSVKDLSFTDMKTELNELLNKAQLLENKNEN